MVEKDLQYSRPFRASPCIAVPLSGAARRIAPERCGRSIGQPAAEGAGAPGAVLPAATTSAKMRGPRRGTFSRRGPVEGRTRCNSEPAPRTPSKAGFRSVGSPLTCHPAGRPARPGAPKVSRTGDAASRSPADARSDPAWSKGQVPCWPETHAHGKPDPSQDGPDQGHIQSDSQPEQARRHKSGADTDRSAIQPSPRQLIGVRLKSTPVTR